MSITFESLFHKLEAVDRKLEAVLSSTNTHTPLDEKGGISLAISITGLSKARIYTLVSERKIPHFKRGNRLFFSRVALEKWIEEGSRQIRKGVLS